MTKVEKVVLTPEEIQDGAPMQQKDGGVKDLKLIYPETGLGCSSLCMGIVEIGPGRSSPMHRHNCDEAYYVLKGSGILEIENANGVFEEHKLVTGGCSLQRPNRKHRVKNTGDDVLSLVVIGGIMLVPLLPVWPTQSPYEVFEGNTQNV